MANSEAMNEHTHDTSPHHPFGPHRHRRVGVTQAPCL